MEKNELGTSGIYVSQLTLGCMSLGKEERHAERIIHSALDAGINHLDTADLYDFGRNEEIVGKTIRGIRQELILTSKVGNDFSKGDGTHFWNPSRKHIAEGVRASLKRLQTDYLDFCLLHGGTIDDPIDESIDAFETLKKEGLIRAYGISSIRPNVIREYADRSSIDGVMMQYNMLDRRPEEDILDMLLTKGISVLARGPLAKGMLSNKWRVQLEKKGDSGYLDYGGEELKTIIPLIQEQTGEQMMTETALSYVLSHPAVTTAVFGASSVEQLEENTKSGLVIPLPEMVLASIRELTKPVQYENHR